MGRKVWKYELPLQETFTIDLPIGAQILSVATQRTPYAINDKPVMWALVVYDDAADPVLKLETRHFFIVGTGHPLPVPATHHDHIGTVQIEDFVWHYFEDTAKTGVRRDLK